VRRRRSLGSAAAGKPCTEGFLEIKLMSVPGIELVGEQHQGRALTRETPRRHDTSPGGGRSKLGRQGGQSRRKERQDLASTTLRVGAAGKPRTENF
jgi:hypothetical protein